MSGTASAKKSQRYINTAAMSRHDIVSKDGVPYSDLVLECLEDWISAPAPDQHLLVGLNIEAFSSRREEAVCFEKIRTLGISHQLVNFGGKYDSFSSVLFSKGS